jgi:hypothetical protein
MDRLIISKNKTRKFEKIITQILTKHWEYRNQNNDHFLILDKKTKHYLLIYSEWREGKYYHNFVAHIGILPSGKIGIFANEMEEDLAKELVSNGILASEIVLMMQPEKVRAYTGYGF